jgi:hypothetical protein
MIFKKYMLNARFIQMNSIYIYMKIILYAICKVYIEKEGELGLC